MEFIDNLWVAEYSDEQGCFNVDTLRQLFDFWDI